MNRDRLPVKLVIDGFQRYRERKLDISGLAQNLSKAISLLEGDIPKPLRDAIERAEAQVDSIRFGVNESREAAEVGKVWRELEEIINRSVPAQEP
jgi:hypothetical protein